MVAVEFKGRLGNQIFQYVFLKYLKSKDSSKLYFFSNPHHSYLSRYFELERTDSLKLSSKLYSILVRFIPEILKFKEINITNLQSPISYIPKENTLYKGYFQTDYYYNQIKNDLHLKIKSRYIKDFNTLFSDIFFNNKTIVVHIRLTDYKNYGRNKSKDISLPLKYYRNQLEKIENINNYQVIFTSDDMKTVKEYFSGNENYIFSNSSEIIDFQLIMNSDISIISNSSFAWWAAFLSRKQNIVYAPKYWMGFKLKREHPKGVMTNKFIWCDVDF